MPSVLMIAPLLNGSPDLQLIVDEVLEYELAGTIERKVNDVIVQAGPDLPAGYDEILDSRPLYDSADPPNITGYRMHIIRTETIKDVAGGWATLSDNPLLYAPPRGVVVRVTGTTTMLNTLDTRLQAIDALYGILPGEAIAND